MHSSRTRTPIAAALAVANFLSWSAPVFALRTIGLEESSELLHVKQKLLTGLEEREFASYAQMEAEYKKHLRLSDAIAKHSSYGDSLWHLWTAVDTVLRPLSPPPPAWIKKEDPTHLKAAKLLQGAFLEKLPAIYRIHYTSAGRSVSEEIRQPLTDRRLQQQPKITWVDPFGAPMTFVDVEKLASNEIAGRQIAFILLVSGGNAAKEEAAHPQAIVFETASSLIRRAASGWSIPTHKKLAEHLLSLGAKVHSGSEAHHYVFLLQQAAEAAKRQQENARRPGPPAKALSISPTPAQPAAVSSPINWSTVRGSNPFSSDRSLHTYLGRLHAFLTTLRIQAENNHTESQRLLSDEGRSELIQGIAGQISQNSAPIGFSVVELVDFALSRLLSEDPQESDPDALARDLWKSIQPPSEEDKPPQIQRPPYPVSRRPLAVQQPTPPGEREKLYKELDAALWYGPKPEKQEDRLKKLWLVRYRLSNRRGRWSEDLIREFLSNTFGLIGDRAKNVLTDADKLTPDYPFDTLDDVWTLIARVVNAQTHPDPDTPLIEQVLRQVDVEEATQRPNGILAQAVGMVAGKINAREDYQAIKQEVYQTYPRPSSGLEEKTKFSPEKVRIAFVDDNDQIRMMINLLLEDLLKGTGIKPEQVKIFSQPDEVRQWAKENKGEQLLLLTDLNMYGKPEGFSLAEELKANPSARVIMISSPHGEQEDEVLQRVKDGRLDGFIEKPFGREALQREIQRHIQLPLPPAVQATGLEEQIGSRPASHEIESRFTQQFLSGRLPAGTSASLLDPDKISHPQLATQWIGVDAVARGLVGSGKGLDAVHKRNKVDEADLRAQDVQDIVARAKKLSLDHINFETKGLTPGGLQAGAKGGDPSGPRTPTVSDVVEHTTHFIESQPGASSIQLEGPGVETFGSFPDEARALMVVTHIKPAREAAVLRKYGAASIEELLDPELSVEQLVHRVADLNGVSIGQLDVSILTSEQADIDQLNSLRDTYHGMRSDVLKGGTVQPAVAATLGVWDGRVRVFLRRSGMTEAVFNAIVAGIFTKDGSVAIFRVVSGETKSSFDKRYVWNTHVLNQMRALRPNDWEAIRDGKKIFSSRQVTQPVVGAYTFLTDGRTDQSLPFDVAGVQEIAEGQFQVATLSFTSNPEEPGAGFLWLSQDTYHYDISSNNNRNESTGLEETSVKPTSLDEDKLRELEQRLSNGSVITRLELQRLVQTTSESRDDNDQFAVRIIDKIGRRYPSLKSLLAQGIGITWRGDAAYQKWVASLPENISAGLEEVAAIRTKYAADDYAVGVRVGGNNVSAGLVNRHGETETATALPEAKWRKLSQILELLGNPSLNQEINDALLELIPRPDHVLTEDQRQIARQIADLVTQETIRHIVQLIQQTGLPVERFKYSHISFPGPVDSATGRVGVPYAAANVPGFEDYPLAEKIQQGVQEQLGVTVRVEVENDAGSGLKGETTAAGTAAGLKKVVSFIWGTGMNAASDTKGIDLIEVGHGLVGKIGADGLTHYELRDARRSRPVRAAHEFEMEQRLGGEVLEAWFQEHEFQDGADVTWRARSGNQNSEDQETARSLITTTGQDLGRAIAALLRHYYVQQNFIPSSFVLTSGVSENFGKLPDGQVLTDAQGKDLLVGAVQDGAFQELTVRFMVAQDVARQMANAIVRTKMDASREFAAAAEGLKRATQGRNQPTAGLEEPAGFVAVGGMAVLAPAEISHLYAVTVGVKQTRAVLELSRVPPSRVVAVAVELEEVATLEVLGIPGTQILHGWAFPSLAQAKEAAIQWARRAFEIIDGVKVQVVDATALTVQELASRINQMLPRAWRSQSITSEDLQRVHDVSEFGV